jgi:hypothetical protein
MTCLPISKTTSPSRWAPTGGDEPTYEFALFSRSGFKRSTEEAVDERDDLRLFDLSDIVAVLESKADQ